MSAPAQAPPVGGATSQLAGSYATPTTGEACPLCATPLQPEQEWCLSCGAAARTRLAASPNWKAPLTIALVVVVLSLGVLAAALVKLAGGSGAERPVTTRTVTTPPAAVVPTVTATTPSVTIPTTTTPSPSPSTSTPTIPTPTTVAPGGARAK